MQYEGLSVFDLIMSSGGGVDPALKAQVEQNTYDIGVSGLNIGANSNNIITLQQKTNQITKGPYSTTIDDLVILTSGLQVANDLSVGSINKLSAVGGQYSSTYNTNVITTMGSLIPLNHIGELAVPQMKTGDVYRIFASGIMPTSSQDDFITIYVNSTTTNTLLLELRCELSNQVNGFFNLDVRFQARDMGSMSGQLVTCGSFDYIARGYVKQGWRAMDVVDVNTNTLDISVICKIDGLMKSSIQTNMFYIRKEY